MAVKLVAQTGRTAGSRASGRLRRDGMIPAVVYGQGVDSLPISVNGRELRTALNTDAGVDVEIELTVDGKTHKVKAHQLAKHPVRHTVQHVDFLIQP